MITTIYRFAALFCCACLLCNVALRNAYANENTEQQFTFCYQDIELYPNYTGNSARVPERDPGLIIELVQKASASVGLTPTFVRFPWKRCLALLKLGRVDSVVASYRKERADAAAYPMIAGEPDDEKFLTISGYYLYQLRGTVDHWDGHMFSSPDIIIGAPLGYSITAELKEKHPNIVETGTAESLFQMLQYSRIDAVAAPGVAADAILHRQSNSYAAIRKIEVPLKMNHYFLVFSHQFYKENTDTVVAVWHASPNVHKSEIAQLQQKYAAALK